MITGGDVKTLGAVVEEYSELKVADYQRNYNWERDQILDLWNDLLESTGNSGDHFFGSLILEKDLINTGRPKAEVVDGQQRLTTLMLLVARLRDEILRLGGDDRIHDANSSFSLLDELNKFLGLHPRGTKFIPNLLIRGEYQEVLKVPVFGSGDQSNDGRNIKVRSRDASAGATLNFRNGYFLIRKLVMHDLVLASKGLPEGESFDAKKNRIYVLWLTITEKFKVLTISTTTQAESLEVFLTTNDRGLDLGVMDLVRGKILSAITRRESSDDKRKAVFESQIIDLEKIANQVGTAKQIDQFLRQWLHLRPETISLKDGKKTYLRLTMKKVPEFIEEQINLASKSKGGAEKKASDLWEDIKYGATVHPRTLGDSDEGIGPESRLRLMSLKSAIKSYRILALRICDKKVGLTKDQVNDLVKALLRAVFAHTLAGGNAQDLEVDLQKMAHNLTGASSVGAVVSDLEKLRSQSGLTREHIESAAGDQSYIRAFLFALAAESGGKAGVISQYDVEHIAPNTPNDHWRNVLNAKGSEYKSIVSRLGNMTLLDTDLNNELKQKEYSEKRVRYRGSNVAMARKVAQDYQIWGEAQIDSRTKELIDSLFALLN